MRAALQRGFIQSGLGQHGARQFDMLGLAGMGGTGQRQFFLAEAVSIGRAAFDERQRLDRLDGGPREDRPVRIADLYNGPAVGIIDGDRAAMGAFHHRAARHLDHNRIRHPITAQIAAF